MNSIDKQLSAAGRTFLIDRSEIKYLLGTLTSSDYAKGLFGGLRFGELAVNQMLDNDSFTGIYVNIDGNRFIMGTEMFDQNGDYLQ